MFLKEFKDLRRKRGRLLGLPDQLNYAIPIDDYTIAMKDGAFLSAFDCAGLDLNSASVEELDAHRAQANRALARLDDGFMYNIDLIRHPALTTRAVRFPIPSARRSIASGRFNTPLRVSTSRPDAFSRSLIARRLTRKPGSRASF
jgi:type IV secretory pathway VirB4 component